MQQYFLRGRLRKMSEKLENIHVIDLGIFGRDKNWGLLIGKKNSQDECGIPLPHLRKKLHTPWLMQLR